MPRPTRRRFFLLPSAGLIVLSRMLLSLDAEQVAHLVDHAARRRRVDDLDRVVGPLEAEATHGGHVILAAARNTLGKRDLDLFSVGHDYAPRISSTVLPRLAAISDGA